MGQLAKQVFEELRRYKLTPFTEMLQELQLIDDPEHVLQLILQERQVWLPVGAYCPSGQASKQVPNPKAKYFPETQVMQLLLFPPVQVWQEAWQVVQVGLPVKDPYCPAPPAVRGQEETQYLPVFR